MNSKRVKFGTFFMLACLAMNSCKKEGFLPKKESDYIQKSTCEQIELLQNDQELIAYFKILHREATVNNFETGFVLTKKDNETFDYQKITGEENKASISFVVPAPIDGFIHAHHSNLYPNFSASDIKAMYHVYHIGKMKNPLDFILGLVTSTGSTYLVKITDPLSFKTFGETNFDDDIVSEKFEKQYLDKVNAYNIYGRENSFELALIEMLKGSGLVLFRGNTRFDNWMRVSLKDQGSVLLSPCI